MRTPLYDTTAKKQTVSLSVNADLFAKVKSAGINASRVAEEALAKAYTDHMREVIREEIRQEIAAIDAFEAEHGSFPEMVREYYESLAGNDDEAA